MSRVTHLLIDRGDLRRIARANQGHGRWLETYAAFATGVACRVWSRSTVVETSVQKEIAGQIKTYVQHVGYFEPDQDIARDDTLTVTVKDGATVATPVTYRVTGVTPPSKAHHMRVTLEEIQVNAS